MMLEEQQNKCMECRGKDVKIRKQKCCRINFKNLKPFSWNHTHILIQSLSRLSQEIKKQTTKIRNYYWDIRF